MHFLAERVEPLLTLSGFSERLDKNYPLPSSIKIGF
jgi:hypothetical protein